MSIRFKLTLNTSTIQPAPLLTKIEAAAAAGFDGIELWSRDLSAYEAEHGSLDDVRAALNDHGLFVPSVIHLKDWMDTEGAAYEAALDEARRQMEQAAEVGAKYIIAGPPAGPVHLADAGRRYRELLAIGKEFGVLPAVEFLGFVEGVNTLDKAWRIVEEAGDQEGTIVVDPFHIFRGGSSVDDLEGIPVERIAVYHFNDAPGDIPREAQTDSDRVMPGDGILPLAYQLRHLVYHGYEGALSLELFNPELWEKDPFDVAAEGHYRIMELLDTVDDSLS